MSWFELDHARYALHNAYWHLWIYPDYRLIECLVLEVVVIVSLVMSVTSICSMISYLRKYRQTEWHCSIPSSIGILSLSTCLAIASLLLLVYQQNGRHFDRKHILCQIAVAFLIIFAVLVPIVIIASIVAYLKWSKLRNRVMTTAENHGATWHDIRPLDRDYNIDLRNLVAVRPTKKEKSDADEKEENGLLNEKTNEKITQNKGDEIEIVFIAHKSRYQLHLLALLAQLILFAAVQHKNYYEEQEQMVLWAHRYSKLINEDDYYMAKWELENGIEAQEQTFETLEWLEYVARNNLHKHKA